MPTPRAGEAADARNRTPHWLMREAIREYVDREEKGGSVRARSVDDYRAHGAHVTQAEADAWLPLEAGMTSNRLNATPDLVAHALRDVQRVHHSWRAELDRQTSDRRFARV
jgi:predicted transcriptional regulator